MTSPSGPENLADAERRRALLARFRAGEQGALAELIERQLDWLEGYVRKRLGAHLRRHDESVDFVQQAVTDLLARDATIRLDDEGGLRALLARIVDNDLRDRHRFHHRAKRDTGREAGEATDSILLSAFKSVTTPSVVAQRRETAAWMQRALEELSPEDREVIRLHEFERLSHGEIAERLGISPDAARVRFQRALPRLAMRVAELRADR